MKATNTTKEKRKTQVDRYGEHIPVEWEDYNEIEYIRGHVSEKEALDKMIQWGILPEGEGPVWVKHRYARNVFGQFLVDEEKGRGAFAVTEVWFEEPPKKGIDNGASVA